MRLQHFIVLLVLAGSAGILLVWQNTRLYSVGYKISEIDKEYQEIDEEIERLEVALQTARTRSHLYKLAEEHGLRRRLAPPVDIEDEE